MRICVCQWFKKLRRIGCHELLSKKNLRKKKVK